MAEIVGQIVGRLAVPILSAIARAAAPAIGTIIVRPLSSAFRGAGEMVLSAVERHNHEVRRASWNSSITVEDLLGNKPYTQSIPDTIIRANMHLLLENLRILIDADDEMDERYTSFGHAVASTRAQTVDMLSETYSDLNEEVAGIVFRGIGMVRHTNPNEKHRLQTLSEKEEDRHRISQKVGGAILELCNLYSRCCR
jgi:hypothetical protein